MRRITLLLVFTAVFVAGCAGGLNQRGESRRKAKKTVVLFLVDGLSASTLQVALHSGKAPNIQNYFLGSKDYIPLGRASFPSLTYPNIASILTSKRVGEQPITSNHVVIDGIKVVNFESPRTRELLYSNTEPYSIFQRLNAEKLDSASFSYVFGENASTHMDINVADGIDYIHHQYRELDENILSRLENFLQERVENRNLPAFIYVHLVGIDGISHRYGSKSKKVQDYLHWLDNRASAIFTYLARAEKSGQKMEAILTADHGFVDADQFVDLEKHIKKNFDGQLTITNENRFLGLYLKPNSSSTSVEALESSVRNLPGAEFLVIRKGSVIEFISEITRKFILGKMKCANGENALSEVTNGSPSDFHCSSYYDRNEKYPFIISDLTNYLTVGNHPDAVLLAKSGFAFSNEFLGNHGGASREEMMVPILTRNILIPKGQVYRTSELLKNIAHF